MVAAIALGPLPASASPYAAYVGVWVMNADGTDHHAAASIEGNSWQVSPVADELLGVSQNDIYKQILDGERHQLTATDFLEWQPRWSPDGESIAFLRNELPQSGHQLWKLYVMNDDGTDARLIAEIPDLNIVHPRWSADGSRIAFIAERYESTEGGLYVVDADGSDLEEIVERPVSGPPAWSPDGEQIAFTTRDGDLNVVPSNGGEDVDVTDEPIQKLNPEWSPDGREILVTGYGPGLAIIDPHDGDVRYVQSGSSYSVSEAHWSSDGDRILASNYGTTYVLDSSNGEVLMSTDDGSDYYSPQEGSAQWSHDEERIFYARSEWGGIPQTYDIERTLSHTLRKHSKFVGRLKADATVCVAEVPLKLRYRRSSRDAWRTIVDFKTRADGTFKWPVPDRSGQYRAIAPRLTTQYNYDQANCLRSVGPVVRHTH